MQTNTASALKTSARTITRQDNQALHRTMQIQKIIHRVLHNMLNGLGTITAAFEKQRCCKLIFTRMSDYIPIFATPLNLAVGILIRKRY